jgi:hypothetical protein
VKYEDTDRGTLREVNKPRSTAPSGNYRREDSDRQLHLTMSIDNADFCPDGDDQLNHAAIFQAINKALAGILPGQSRKIVDGNGNTVGKVRIDP